METHPPKLIEKIAGALIPRECREHVLGDLHERYESPTQYLRDVLAAVPFVIASQIRRTFRVELFFAEACGLYVAFGGASLIAGPGYLYDHRALYPLGIVIVVVLLVFVLCDAYSGRHTRASQKEWMNVVLPLIVAFCARPVILALETQWMLPAWIMVLGSAVAIPMLTMLRDFFRQTPHRWSSEGNQRLPNEIESNPRQRKATTINSIWLIVASLVGVRLLMFGPITGASVGTTIVILAIVCITAWRRIKVDRQ